MADTRGRLETEIFANQWTSNPVSRGRVVPYLAKSISVVTCLDVLLLLNWMYTDINAQEWCVNGDFVIYVHINDSPCLRYDLQVAYMGRDKKHQV